MCLTRTKLVQNSSKTRAKLVQNPYKTHINAYTLVQTLTNSYVQTLLLLSFVLFTFLKSDLFLKS